MCNSKALQLNSSPADMEWNSIEITSRIIRKVEYADGQTETIFSVFTQLMQFVQMAR